MTSSQHSILTIMTFLFGEKVVESQLANPPLIQYDSATIDEQELCQLNEDETYFLNLIPLENKHLLASHLFLVDALIKLWWEMIRINHYLQHHDIIGLRRGYKIVKMKDKRKEVISSLLNKLGIEGLIQEEKKPEPKDMN